MAIGSFVQVSLYIIFSLIYLVAINYGLQGVDAVASSVVMFICEIMFKILIFVQMVHIFILVFPFFINQSSVMNIQAQYQTDDREGMDLNADEKKKSEKSQTIDADTVMVKSGALYEPDSEQGVFNKTTTLNLGETEDVELQ